MKKGTKLHNNFVPFFCCFDSLMLWGRKGELGDEPLYMSAQIPEVSPVRVLKGQL
jgi:hypothetical protein